MHAHMHKHPGTCTNIKPLIHTHKHMNLWLWPKRPPLTLTVAEVSVPKCPGQNVRGWNVRSLIILHSIFLIRLENYKRTNGPVNAHLISGLTGSTKTNKIGQSQPRVIIYINFVELESPMLHTNFQDHRISGSGEEDF